jgi:hypothetical protein
VEQYPDCGERPRGNRNLLRWCWRRLVSGNNGSFKDRGDATCLFLLFDSMLDLSKLPVFSVEASCIWKIDDKCRGCVSRKMDSRTGFFDCASCRSLYGVVRRMGPPSSRVRRKAPFLSVGTLWRHEKVGRIVMVFKCLREESIYNVGASLYRLAAGRWDER